MKRHPVNNPEVVPLDIEGGSRTVSMAPPPVPYIQPFQGYAPATHASRRSGRGGVSSPSQDEGFKNSVFCFSFVWVIGWLVLGYDFFWPLQVLLSIMSPVFTYPPLSWVLGWMYRGDPLLSQASAAEELQLPLGQVSAYLDSYATQYGDAALLFAAHDGYHQVVKGLLFSEELGYRELVNARDDIGNTALLYAAAKGFRQTCVALLRGGANTDEANVGGGGRTPLMEAAGGGFRDIVEAMRLANATIDLKDDYGNSALHYAAYHGQLSTTLELLKANPRRDIKNSHGHTPASYAAANNFKAVADLLSRPAARAVNHLVDGAGPPEEHENEAPPVVPLSRQLPSERHVKGVAEDFHRNDQDFAKLEKLSNVVSQAEHKALEDSLSRMRQEHEETELRSQKRIVELLERSTSLSQAVDKAEREKQILRLNNTELLLRVSEVESKVRLSDRSAKEEAERASSLAQALQRVQAEAELQKSRADASEQARASREEIARTRDVESAAQLERLQEQQRETLDLRERLAVAESEARRRRDNIEQMEMELHRFRDGATSEPRDEAVAVDMSIAIPDLGADDLNAVGGADDLPRRLPRIEHGEV